MYILYIIFYINIYINYLQYLYLYKLLLSYICKLIQNINKNYEIIFGA